MRTQILSIRQRLVALFFARKYTSKPVRCEPHMNELPVPCIPWEPWYTNKQKMYTRHLMFGIFWWLFSLGMALYTDSIYLNWGPPKQPGPPSDMVEECEELDD
ncbi:unnamed protein product [Parnassius mnemosyne]|uniref:Deltamethrin resistance protein prag01 domain-containing protein n=1 Tax=Parnassius mnemosyne TaxID=213953 RepID=A0AAV1M9Z1_9NEOP